VTIHSHGEFAVISLAPKSPQSIDFRGGGVQREPPPTTQLPLSQPSKISSERQLKTVLV
jgi:hypothetical protein